MEYQFKTELICLPSGSTMKQAKELMLEKRIRHLPITNENNQIVSLLSKHDLTDVAKLQDLPVDFFATAPVTYVTTDTSLKTVALKMLEENISCVLIADANKNVEGIITTHDLLFHLVQLLNEKEESAPSITSSSALITIGEFFRKLADVGI